MQPLPTGFVSPKGKTLEDFLNSRVKGQRRAIRYLREYMEIYWANLGSPDRPIGNFLFAGPSGVGKTELAKALADYMFGSPDRLTIIDCSEYSEGHEISALVGAPPSYVGHGQSAPKLTQWNIDRHHVAHFCETGKFWEEFIKDREGWIHKLEKAADIAKMAITLLDQKIVYYEGQIAELNKNYPAVVEDTKSGGDKGNNAKLFKQKMEKSLEKLMRDIREAKENIKNEEKRLGVLEREIERIKGRIKDWQSLKEESFEKRFNEFQKIILEKEYVHRAGRYLSIILWDEIEKAGQKLHNLLLSIMDRGMIELYDPPGDVTSFTNAINIFTSNLGSDKIADMFAKTSNDSARALVGFGKPRRPLSENEIKNLDEQIYEMTKTELRSFFQPEFVGRINKLVVFRPLDEAAMRQIVDMRIEDRNNRQLIELEVGQEVKDFLVREAMKTRSDGARLLDERIKQFVDTDIAPLINGGLLELGDTVVVKLGKDNKLEFYKKSPPAK